MNWSAPSVSVASAAVDFVYGAAGRYARMIRLPVV